MSKNDWLTPDGLDHYHKGISDILDKNLNGDFVENNEFTFRATDGITSIKTGMAYLERIKGNTVKWNQLLRANKLVDMGLPSGTLWATCNIDVTQDDGFTASPYQYECSFFSWGNVDGHNPISNNAFDYNFGGINSNEPWYEGQPYGETQGNTLTSNIPANATYDAARSHLGASWRMPTHAEFVELFANIKYINADGTEVDTTKTDKRVTVNGIVGLYLESKINGARLFFSCSGYGNGRSWSTRRALGRYWSSTFHSARYARILRFGRGSVDPQGTGERCTGFAVRPVTNSAIVTDENGHKYAASGKYIIDLTLMYGEGNEPSTIAKFEADYYKWFGKPLTSEDYDAGSLRSVQMNAIKTTGFNQFDEQVEGGSYNDNGARISGAKLRSKNLIPVISGERYYYKSPVTCNFFLFGADANTIVGLWTGDNNNFDKDHPKGSQIFWYPNTEKIIPSDCKYIAFSTFGSQYTAPSQLLGQFCFNISHSGKRNGEYEPHWEETKNVPVTTRTGKLNGEGESVIVFPDGMKSAGEVHDEIYIENGKTYAIKRVGSVDLGTLTWRYNNDSAWGAGSYCFKGNLSDAKQVSKNEQENRNQINSKYRQVVRSDNIYTGAEDKCISFSRRSTYGGVPTIRDTSYTDAATFKAAMQGVMLYYELATPLVYELDNFQLPLPYRVDDYGTEEVTGAENSVAPTLDIRYGVNIIDTIRNLPKTIDSIEEEISDANDRIDDAFDAIDAKEDKLAFSHSTGAVPPSTALTFTPNVNTIYYQHESTPVIGNINMVLPVPTTERATIKVIYRNSTANAPTITSAEGVKVIIESNIGGPYRLTTINCEWYHDCWVVDIQTHGT